jgi:hypothetical protein
MSKSVEQHILQNFLNNIDYDQCVKSHVLGKFASITQWVGRSILYMGKRVSLFLLDRTTLYQLMNKRYRF